MLPYAIIVLFVALSIGSALSESRTYDEIVHAQEGVNALTKHTFLVDTNNPPFIRELAMVPTVLGLGTLIPPRIIIIFLGVLVLVAVYRFTLTYFGRPQALFALFLLAFEPNFLGNSHYVTLDVGATFFVFIGYIAYIRLLENYTLQNLIITSTTWGLAFSSKMTSPPFLLISSIITGLVIFRKPFKRLVSKVIHFLLFACVTGFVIWATYFFTFDVIIAPRSDPGRVSSRLHAYAAAHNYQILDDLLTFGETVKLPLGNYLAVIKNTLMWSKARPEIFYLGNFYPTNQWYFMPVNLFLKLQIPLIIFFAFGLSLIKSRRKIAIAAVPVLVILGVTSLVNNQPWVRYALPAIPFIAIVASNSTVWLSSPIRKFIFLILCLWYAYGIATSFPNFISYANEFVGPPASRYRVFMDSNLDWGQSLPDFAKYVESMKPGFISFSYFGRDNADKYGFSSDLKYGSHRFEEICAFHHINLSNLSPKVIMAISVSNWYYCGYYKDPRYSRDKVRDVVADSILLFYE